MNFLQKTALPLLTALAFTFSAASAQTTPTMQGPGQHAQRSPQEMAQHQTQKLSKKLNLTADQSARVQQILQQRAQEMQALRAKAPAGTDRKQLHEQAKASRAKYDGQLKGVLSADQFGKYTAMRNERHHHHGRPDGKLKTKDGDSKLKSKTSQG